MNIDLIICILGAVCYVFIIFFYTYRIQKIKKALPKEKIIPLTSKSFKTIFIFASLLLILPLFIPLQTYVTAICCACAVLGAYLALKDRLEQIKNI